MANEPFRRPGQRPPNASGERPKIWAEGSQRPRFDLRAFGKASFRLAREGAAPLLAWAARMARRVAVNVRNGAGRIPAGKLGRFERFVPSHLRVAHWIKTLAAVMAHASANADPDVKRGNTLVSEIEPHLWAPGEAVIDQGPEAMPTEPTPVMPEDPAPPRHDPLAAIRSDLGDTAPRQRAARKAPSAPPAPARPPAPPGQVGTMVVQMTGYVMGWGTVILALPYGLGRAIWLHVTGTDLRRIGTED